MFIIICVLCLRQRKGEEIPSFFCIALKEFVYLLKYSEMKQKIMTIILNLLLLFYINLFLPIKVRTLIKPLINYSIIY